MGIGGRLCLVNGTRHHWKKVNGHDYQMVDVQWEQTINSFSTNTMYFEFDRGALIVDNDSESWAEYEILGTTSRFRIWLNRKTGIANWKLQLTHLTTLNDPQGTEIDLGFCENPAPEPYYNGTTCIIAGVDGAFVSTSRNFIGPWMSKSLSYLGQRNLQQICVPGSHNSGINCVTYRAPIVTPDSLILCQRRSVGDQLRYGVRYFDIRPVIANNVLATGHYGTSSLPLIKWGGGSGQPLREIIDQVNDFTRNNAELVVLYVSHAKNIDKDFVDFTTGDWTRVFEEFDRLEHRFSATGEQEKDLSKVKLNDFIGQNRAAVIIKFDLSKESGALLGERAGKGFFYSSSLPIYDEYANKSDPNQVVNDQIEKLRRERKNPNSKVFCLGWAMTQQGAADATKSIVEWGERAMNPRLGADLLVHVTNMTYPNILGMDGVQTTMGVAAATAINARARP